MRALLALAVVAAMLTAVSFWWPGFQPLSAFLALVTVVAIGAYIEEAFGGP